MARVGWQATPSTVSEWPSRTWTTFLDWTSQMYTRLSSDPPTSQRPGPAGPPVAKAAGMQNLRFSWPR